MSALVGVCGITVRLENTVLLCVVAYSCYDGFNNMRNNKRPTRQKLKHHNTQNTHESTARQENHSETGNTGTLVHFKCLLF